jgi:ABC-2 type transport system ATP-binding protein
LCLAHALVHDPQVLLLDEPASGLDPRARVEMRELLRELGAMGKTVVLSSHILSELSELCDSIGIIEKGHLVANGLLEQIQHQVQGGRKLHIKVLSDPQAAITALRAQPQVSNVILHDPEAQAGPDSGMLDVDFLGDESAVADLLETLVAQRVRVVFFREEHTDLEDLFLRLTKGEAS